MIIFETILVDTTGHLQFQARGDGTSTVLKVNISVAPFDLPRFGDQLPAGVEVNIDLDEFTITGTITAETDGDMLTLTFSDAIPDGALVNIDVVPYFNSLV